MKRIYTGIFALTAMMALPGAAMLQAQQPDDSGVVMTSTNLSPGEKASELYKKVKFMLYEGELESVIYPAAIEAANAGVAALEAATVQSDIDRAVSIIRDLNPLMAQGAIYYSSQGNSAEQSRFARAYVDQQTHPGMKGVDFDRNPALFSQLVYSAAYGATQDNDTEGAKKYFRLYLDSGEESHRENVIIYYGQSCLATSDYANGLAVLEEGTRRYPTNMQILTLAIQTCLDGQMIDRMPPLLEKAIALNPNEEKLQNLQAQLLERNGEYAAAADLYQQLAETHPNSLEIHQAIARCYYNLGASHYNSSIMEKDEKVASRHRRQSKTYFNSAIGAINLVLANTPADMTFLAALASSYASLGDREKFDEVNRTIRGYGGEGIAFNAMPALIGANNTAVAEAAGSTAADIPTFDEFATPILADRLGKWGVKSEFEKMEDYRKRITQGGAESTYLAILAEAEKEYLDKYASSLVLSDLTLSPYDVEHETYRIDTPYGPTVVKVPMKNKEAEGFKAGWNNAQLRTPRFIIQDHKPTISEIVYVVNGKRYPFKSEKAEGYTTPRVYVDWATIFPTPGPEGPTGGTLPDGGTIFKDSDIDVNIPMTGKKATNLYALIIVNENYDQADKVEFALHDGVTFKKYCTQTLGIPENNIIFVNNATGNQVRDALSRFSRKVRGAGEGTEAIVYYAGHGLPDEATHEAYMVPVDANPLLTTTLIPMKEVYATLGDLPTEATSVFVDACFSGTDRSGSMINKGRGVAFSTRPATPEGNMFVLSAASSQETALPYKDKYHGLFSYYLMKKLQESKGNATLREISDYVINNVRRTADEVNGKPQNPTVSTSGKLATSWDSKKLKP